VVINMFAILSLSALSACEPNFADVTVAVEFPGAPCIQRFVAQLPMKYWFAYDETPNAPFCDDRAWSLVGADGSWWTIGHDCGVEVTGDPFFSQAPPPNTEPVTYTSTPCAEPLSPPWTYPVE